MSKEPLNKCIIRRYRPRPFMDLPLDWRTLESVRMHYRFREFTESIRILRELIEQQGEVPVELHYELARTYNRLAHDEQAQAALFRAIEREPGYQEAVSLLGHSLTCTKDFDRAGYYLRLATALDPGDNVPWARLSNLYTAMGNLDAAHMVQLEAVKRNPQCPMLKRRLLELVLFGLDDPPEEIYR